MAGASGLSLPLLSCVHQASSPSHVRSGSAAPEIVAAQPAQQLASKEAEMEERRGNFAHRRSQPGRMAGERPRLLRSCPPDRNFSPRWADSCATPRAPLASPSGFFFFSLFFDLFPAKPGSSRHTARASMRGPISSPGATHPAIPAPLFPTSALLAPISKSAWSKIGNEVTLRAPVAGLEP